MRSVERGICPIATNCSNNKITFKRTWSLSNAVCFKYVKYLTTNTAKCRSRDPFSTPFDLIFHYYR